MDKREFYMGRVDWCQEEIVKMVEKRNMYYNLALEVEDKPISKGY